MKIKKPSKSELDNAYNSFPSLLDLIEKYAGKKLEGIEINDIEHYHRIRNTLYHQGTGLSVSKEYVELYNSIAKILLNNLFGIDIKSCHTDKSIYSEILLGWSQIAQLLSNMATQRGIEGKKRLNWDSIQEQIISEEIMNSIRTVREERNRIAHNNSLDTIPDKSILLEIEKIKHELTTSFNSYSKKYKTDYYYYPSISKIEGELTLQSFFVPPSYGEDPVNDEREDVYILRLNYHINVISEKEEREEGDLDSTKLNIKEVQICTLEPIRHLVNKKIKVSGIFFGANTGHHWTPVILDVKDINKN